jgi:hypothetical protein
MLIGLLSFGTVCVFILLLIFCCCMIVDDEDQSPSFRIGYLISIIILTVLITLIIHNAFLSWVG